MTGNTWSGSWPLTWGLDGVWLSTDCAGCAQPFDVFVEQSSLPVKPAGEGYPFAEAETSLGRRRFRVPTGEDQEALAVSGDRDESVQALARRLLTDGPNERQTPWPEEDIERIESAVEAASPEVSTWALAECPDCGRENRVALDPYLVTEFRAGQLFQQIHTLAMFYHWSEAEILDFPAVRRRRYLQLIDQSREMVQ